MADRINRSGSPWPGYGADEAAQRFVGAPGQPSPGPLGQRPPPSLYGVRPPSPGPLGQRPLPSLYGVRPPSPGPLGQRPPPSLYGVRPPSPGPLGQRPPSPGPSGRPGPANIDPYRNIYDRLRAGQCRDYVFPKVQYNGAISNEIKTAWSHASRALGAIFPPGFNKISIESVSWEGIKGTTRISDDGRTAYVKINTNRFLPSEDQIGLYAHTIAHELFLHAQSQMEATYCGKLAKGVDEDHRHTYSPTNSGNRYLQAMHRVFDQLPTNAKQSFSHAVQEDIRAQSDGDDELGQTEFEQIDLWSSDRRASMDDAIANRRRHNWS
jgi:hypothetical protein